MVTGQPDLVHAVDNDPYALAWSRPTLAHVMHRLGYATAGFYTGPFCHERFGFDRLKKGDYDRGVFKNPGEVAASGTEERREPAGFFRKGKSGTWRDELSQAELNSFLWVAGDLLEELGYLGEHDPKPPRRAPLSAVARSALYGVRRRLVWVGKRALGSG